MVVITVCRDTLSVIQRTKATGAVVDDGRGASSRGVRSSAERSEDMCYVMVQLLQSFWEVLGAAI